MKLATVPALFACTAFAAALTGCKAGTPATTTTTETATVEPVTTVDVSGVVPLQVFDQTSAEMGGPEAYTLKLIGSADDLPEAVTERGLEVDFEMHDVVLLGMGTQPTSGYAAEITGVQQVGDTVFVQASFSQPAPDDSVAQVVTQPWTAAVIYKRPEGVTLRSDFD